MTIKVELVQEVTYSPKFIVVIKFFAIKVAVKRLPGAQLLETL